ncbi:Stress response RCI peptide [Madurella fahalii]|uniref:Stress response RCI peptide n=1 Tax=Madurella fahalii TaxID=1157608 RepID=A0ABQ0GNF2_9PEZI
MSANDIFLGLLAVLFPPLPVWVRRGICSLDSLLNILLCVLGFVPGLLHAWYIIARHPDPPYDYDYQPVPGSQGRHQDAEHGRIYVFVHNGHGQGQGHAPQQQGVQPKYGGPGGQAPMNYGSTSQGGGSASAPSQPPPQQHQQHEHGTAGEAGPSDGGAPPPSYAQVVAGDHKVQTQD